MTFPLPKISFIIPVLHLKRPLNKARFFMTRYTLPDVLRDLRDNVSLPHEVIGRDAAEQIDRRHHDVGELR